MKAVLDQVMDLLIGLYDDVQDCREDGETDLRTVLHMINKVIGRVDILRQEFS